MDPVTIGLMIVSAAASSGGGIMGAQSQGRATRTASRFQAHQSRVAAAAEAEDTIDDAYYAAGRNSAAAAYLGERQAKAYSEASERAARNAELALMQTNFEENRAREQGEATFAAQTVFYAGSGIDLSEGAPILMAREAAEQLEVDAQIIRASGWAKSAEMTREAGRFATAANDAVTEAKLAIEDNAQAAARTGDKALRTLAFRENDTTGQARVTRRAAGNKQTFDTAAALLGGLGQIAGGFAKAKGPAPAGGKT
jgi:hypothetical protein